MKPKLKYTIYQDLIGMNVSVCKKNDPQWTGFRPMGTVVDDRYATLVVDTPAGRKTLLKEHYVFRFEVADPAGHPASLQVDGSKIFNKPENRLKLIRKQRWIKT
jgi:RNase P/RNase MRP subunit p29